MITVRTLSAPTRCTTFSTSLQPAVYATGYEPWGARRAPQIRLSVEEENVVQEESIRAGSRPRRFGPSYGKLRDKGVFHLNAKGVIRVLDGTSVCEFRDAGSGMVQPVYLTTSGAKIPAWIDAHWGSPISMRMDIPSYTQDYKGTLYAIGPSSWKLDATWNGDVGYITYQVINPTRNKVGVTPPTPGLPPRYGFVLLKRIGNAVYHKQYPSQWYDGYVTGSDRLAASIEVQKPGTAGYTNGTKDFVVFDDSEAKARIIDEIVSSANYHLSRMDIVSDFQPDFGKLALSCFDQLRFVDKSVFNLVFDVLNFRDLLNWGKSVARDADFKRISSSFNAILRAKGPKKARAFLSELRKSSNAFLGTKYGVFTNVSDIRSLIRGFGQVLAEHPSQRLHSRKETLTSSSSGRPISILSTLTIECDKYPTWFTGRIQSGIGRLKKMGLYPEIYDLWDIVPYSFVLDWFIPVGDLLEDVSNYLNVRDYFPIRYCIMSDRREAVWDVRELYSGDDFSSATITGSITLRWYYRWISRKLPLPTVSLKAESTVGDHLLESTALIVQRIR